MAAPENKAPGWVVLLAVLAFVNFISQENRIDELQDRVTTIEQGYRP